MRTEKKREHTCSRCGTSYQLISEGSGFRTLFGPMTLLFRFSSENADVIAAMAPCPHCGRQLPGAVGRMLRPYARAVGSALGVTIALGLLLAAIQLFGEDVPRRAIADGMLVFGCVVVASLLGAALGLARQRMKLVRAIHYTNVRVPPIPQALGPFRSLGEAEIGPHNAH